MCFDNARKASSDKRPNVYFVYNPQGSAPKKVHKSYEDAKAEAERLARENPGTEFLILGAVATAKTEMPVKVTRIEDAQERHPFEGMVYGGSRNRSNPFLHF